MSTEYADEFPLLASIGLYATPTSGEGNCLFHALSDQVCTLLLFFHKRLDELLCFAGFADLGIT